jgi:hypothetical protein
MRAGKHRTPHLRSHHHLCRNRPIPTYRTLPSQHPIHIKPHLLPIRSRRQQMPPRSLQPLRRHHRHALAQLQRRLPVHHPEEPKSLPRRIPHPRNQHRRRSYPRNLHPGRHRPSRSRPQHRIPDRQPLPQSPSARQQMRVIGSKLLHIRRLNQMQRRNRNRRRRPLRPSLRRQPSSANHNPPQPHPNPPAQTHPSPHRPSLPPKLVQTHSAEPSV